METGFDNVIHCGIIAYSMSQYTGSIVNLYMLSGSNHSVALYFTGLFSQQITSHTMNYIALIVQRLYKHLYHTQSISKSYSVLLL